MKPAFVGGVVTDDLVARDEVAAIVARLDPRLSDTSVNAIESMLRETYDALVAQDSGVSPDLRAVAAEAELARVRDGIKALFDAHPDWRKELVDDAASRLLEAHRLNHEDPDV